MYNENDNHDDNTNVDADDKHDADDSPQGMPIVDCLVSVLLQTPGQVCHPWSVSYCLPSSIYKQTRETL